MYYLPQRFINSGYHYTINNYYYTIRTNENCYTQYNTTYCDCYDIYFNNDYLTTQAYTCNYNQNVNISYANFTSDYWYKNNIKDSLLIFIILAIVIIIVPWKIFKRLFGRFLNA